MTWAIFAEAIHSSEFLGRDKSKPKIITLLFGAAGTMCECNITSAQKWINGSRKCKSTKYFPEAKLNNPDGLYKFFRSNTSNKIQKLQKQFQEMGDTDSPIDTETSDMDAFCWSLVDQFLDLLGFPLLSIPSDNNPNSDSDNDPDDNPNSDSDNNSIMWLSLLISQRKVQNMGHRK